jgi:hypothetical protein
MAPPLAGEELVGFESAELPPLHATEVATESPHKTFLIESSLSAAAAACDVGSFLFGTGLS